LQKIGLRKEKQVNALKIIKKFQQTVMACTALSLLETEDIFDRYLMKQKFT
jgi:hypothetical protein